jgi:UDP-N-acetylmuramoyl-tripeptide--D-alanyl-D-alanine ligase
MKSLFKNIIVRILIWEARLVLKKYKPKIIAVTGSVGKTGTKDAIYTLLSSTEHSRKSEKSFNSEIGVPLTILGLPNAWNSVIGWFENILEGFLMLITKQKYPKWLVLEIGVDRPGDIARFSWLRPHIVVFTKFPKIPVHVEYFDSPQEVANEKRTLKNYLRPNGVLITNADDDEMQNEAVNDGQHRLSYGFSNHATVRGFDYRVLYEDKQPVGVTCKATFQEHTIDIVLRGVLGYHHLYPVLCALTVMVAEGKMFTDIEESLLRHTPAPGRMRLLKGVRNAVIVDDSYNSSPIAVRAGITAIAEVNVSGKKIVIVGDMLELGDYSVMAHRDIGEIIAETVDVCIAVGVRSRETADVVKKAKKRCTRVESFKTAVEALDTVQQIIGENDLVFVKGSQGMRMERIVEYIIEDPSKASQLLPRQDSVWKAIK